MMLSAYMDETGHSRDERQKFNGMAGLITKDENWAIYEREWKKILGHFNIPYIHMKESMEMFAGWPEWKVKDLSRCLWEIIVGVEALPIGSIIQMDEFRAREVKLREFIYDPYCLAMQDCMSFATIFVMKGGPFPSVGDPRVALVFSDQAEFKYEGMRLFDAALKHWTHLESNRVDAPAFRDMRSLTPLQGADMVAYEVYKEYERILYKPDRQKRYGYEQIEKMFESFANPYLGRVDLVMWHNEHTLNDIVAKGEQAERTAAYWETKKKKPSG